MAHICPTWIAYLMLNPLRKLLENPDKLLGPYVNEGMTILEPGPAMGYFTLPLARMVGPRGRVVAVDVQQKMLDGLEKRARKAGLSDRIETRLVKVGLSDLAGKVDFSVALHMVHEVPDKEAFFADVMNALKPGGKLLFVEPKGHVTQEKFEKSLAKARKIGFSTGSPSGKVRGRSALLSKPD